MKKVILSMALATAVISANAQDMNSKRGTPILPEAKDWMIGVEASPILEYFGNLFNKDDYNDSPSFNFPNNNLVITGGMVKDETTMYRAKVRLGFGSSKDETAIDATWTPAVGDQVFDTEKNSYNSIALGAGIQKNRGKGRLRGIYGAEAMISLGGGKTTYENGTPDTLITSFVTEEKNGSTLGFGVRAFIGAEYFFAPKMSVSGEFGWGLSISSTGEGETTTKNYGDDPSTTNTTDNVVYTTSAKSGKSSTFGIDTDNVGGAITMHFYF